MDVVLGEGMRAVDSDTRRLKSCAARPGYNGELQDPRGQE